jgi:hypothetical protein
MCEPFGEREPLAKARSLVSEIDEAAREMERDYAMALGQIEKLKGRLNTAEHRASQESDFEAARCIEALDSIVRSISELSDSLIIESKRAWQRYERLKQECEAAGLTMARLDGVRVLCVKTEQLAADLLCYSLGRSRLRATPSG